MALYWTLLYFLASRILVQDTRRFDAYRVAYQFDPNSRIYKERGSLNLFYYELQKDNDAIPIGYTKGLCQKLAENPYDMTAYAELTELINLISHKN